MGRQQNLCLLPKADNSMFIPAQDIGANLAIALLIHYSFDLGGYSAKELVDRWQKQYPVSWLHLAVIEALYQGRYKAISVQQILTFWQRRGQAIFHFNVEFENLICSKFPESLASLVSPLPPPVQTPTKESSKINPPDTTSVVQSSRKEVSTPPHQDPLLQNLTNHPPIGQFTPQTCSSQESFTSKLKAIAKEDELKS